MAGVTPTRGGFALCKEGHGSHGLEAATPKEVPALGRSLKQSREGAGAEGSGPREALRGPGLMFLPVAGSSTECVCGVRLGFSGKYAVK